MDPLVTARQTHVASLFAQIVALTFTSVALAEEGAPSLLYAVLVLGTIITAVQLCFYVVTYYLIFVRKQQELLKPKFRYPGWLVTGVLLVVSLHLLLVFWPSRCTTTEAAFASGSFVAGTVFAVLGVVGVLLCGFVVDMDIVTNPDTEVQVLSGAFVPFAVAFVPALVILGAHYSFEGLVLIVLLALARALHIWCSLRYREDALVRAAVHNGLDIATLSVLQIVRITHTSRPISHETHTHKQPQVIAVLVIGNTTVC